MGRIRGLVAALVWVLSAAVALAATQISFATPDAGDNLRTALLSSSLLRQAQRENTTDPQELLSAAQADYARLLGVLYSKARYGAVINILIDGREAAGIDLLSAPEAIRRIEVRVAAGPIYQFSEAGAAPLAQGTELPSGFAVGEPAETGVIQGAASAAVDGWRATGHAKAEVSEQRIVAYHDTTRLAARLTLAPGPKLSFGTVTVEGNEAVRTARVLKIAGLREGEPYDPKEIDRALKRLRRAGSFRSVTVTEADEIGPGDTLPLTIGVTEQTPRRFGAGVEYSTVEGLRLSGFWMHRNLLGGAERFRVEGEVAGITGETGGIDYRAEARFERPATPSADNDFFAEAMYEILDEPDFKSDTTELTFGFTRYQTDWLTLHGGIGYHYSDVTDDFGHEIYNLVTFPFGATVEKRDDPLNPKRGYFGVIDATPFLGISDTESGGQIKLDARAYRSVGEGDRLTFAGRLQLGSLIGPGLLESPPTFRFFSGGGGTVRGQDYQSLAVDLGGGNRSGGRSFLGLSGEVRADVTEAIGVVAFADWGYIGSEEFPDFTGDSHAGAGLGLRYNTGIGPIRFDLAVPVAGDTAASDYYIYLGIGQAF